MSALTKAKRIVDLYFAPWGAAKGAEWEFLTGDQPFTPEVALRMVQRALVAAEAEKAQLGRSLESARDSIKLAEQDKASLFADKAQLQARVEELQTQRDGWERTNAANLHNLAELRRKYVDLEAKLKQAAGVLRCEYSRTLSEIAKCGGCESCRAWRAAIEAVNKENAHE